MKLVLDDGTEYPIDVVDKMELDNDMTELELEERTQEEKEHNWKGIRLMGTTDVYMTIRLEKMETTAATALARIVVAEKIKRKTP